jgi:hypothetical protein
MCHFSTTDRIRFPPFDRSQSSNGLMPIELFERVAAELFPRSTSVALGCAAEPMVHPEFAGILEVAGRFRVPDVWFPTNLLPLTERTAEAIVDAGVRTVAVSIDASTRETYEKIRVGARFDRLLSRLELLNTVRRRRSSQLPRLRFVFAWMHSNRRELQSFPAFAARHGAEELDVRFVTPAVGVDLRREILTNEPAAELQSELDSAAQSARKLGLRIAAYPEAVFRANGPPSRLDFLKNRWTRFRTGTEGLDYWRHFVREQIRGCAFPNHTWVIRPSGSVLPCLWWNDEPIGFFPEERLASIVAGSPLTRIRQGLACGRPIGSCAACTQRRTRFYEPLLEISGSG